MQSSAPAQVLPVQTDNTKRQIKGVEGGGGGGCYLVLEGP